MLIDIRIIRRSQNTWFLRHTRVRFFALMIHKSVTCAMFPNKPGVPLTKKINYTCTFFWRQDLPIFSFLAHEYFTCFVCVVCFPHPSFKFRSKIFIRRAISEFIPPTHQISSVSPPAPTSSSNRRRRNHSFNHIYVLLRSSQVTHRSLSRSQPDCLNGACETSSCLQIPTAYLQSIAMQAQPHIMWRSRS
jgi:hypothetical protein